MSITVIDQKRAIEINNVRTKVIKVYGVGIQGAAGVGVPAGGTTGQVLRKKSGANYDTEWATGGGGGGAVDSVNGQTGEVVLDKSDIGLDQVDNTSDLNKPISTATQLALDAKLDAALISAFTLQQSYDNSTTPEITTDSTRGAVTIKRGSAADTDNIIEGQNGAGLTTFSVDGNGNVTSTSVNGATAAEMAFLGGVTSAIQTQLNNKQNRIGSKQVAMFIPQGNGTIVWNIGCGHVVTGTATTTNTTNATKYGSFRKVGINSSGAAGSSCGTRNASVQYYLGDAAGRGGFDFWYLFGINTGRAGQRLFQGLYGSAAAIGNVNPSTLTDIIGFGCDSGQTTLHVLHNDASGTATSIDLGAGFPLNTDRTDVYLTRLYATQNASSVSYYVKNIVTGVEASGTINSNLPAQSTLLGPQILLNNGTTAAAVLLDVFEWYMENEL